jgi:hypothetical protein
MFILGSVSVPGFPRTVARTRESETEFHEVRAPFEFVCLRAVSGETPQVWESCSDLQICSGERFVDTDEIERLIKANVDKTVTVVDVDDEIQHLFVHRT